MKVAELQGTELDYWVAKAEGVACNEEDEAYCQKEFGEHGVYWYAGEVDKDHELTGRLTDEVGGVEALSEWGSPSTDWELGGPIIEREKIELSYIDRECWYARVNPNAVEPYGLQHQEGRTPLIAAMRAYVASKFGEEVQ